MNDIPTKLTRLRREMQQQGVDAVIVADADPHNNELVAAPWMYREWLTGFHGSNGTAVITQDQAGLWTDSRYFIAAEDALRGTGIDLYRMGEDDVPKLEEWICETLASGHTVSFPGGETSLALARSWEKPLEKHGLSVRTDLNLVEAIWTDRPAIPTGAIDSLPLEYAGHSFTEKLAQIREKMRQDKLDAYLLGRTDETGWLFNIRGSDLPDSSVVLAYTLITASEVSLIVDPRKLSAEQREQLAADDCRLRPYGEVVDALKELPEHSRLLIDPQHINHQLSRQLTHCELVEERSIATDLKAIKNEVEINHLKQCHRDDGAALVKFFYWLSCQVKQGAQVSELSAAGKLRDLRAAISGFRHVGFSTIIGYNAHGALNHYCVTEETDMPIHAEGLLLVDSGGSYQNGLTDTTRTVPLGPVTEQQKVDYTCVLKGLLRLSMAVFPKTATCAQLDGICRSAMWEQQRDFKHGTGHGVGYGLEVHEGPQGLSARCQEQMKPGMVTTIEPGLYREGEYGIRIENVVLCVEKAESKFGSFYQFEDLTCCPINTRLVQPDMLNDQEIEALDRYHAWVIESLADKLTADEQAWLINQCSPIARSGRCP